VRIAGIRDSRLPHLESSDEMALRLESFTQLQQLFVGTRISGRYRDRYDAINRSTQQAKREIYENRRSP
jgi:cell fate (sporulation/competence/biofilm development) regulator YlbF (YheA/YmcA/DUF963 family)